MPRCAMKCLDCDSHCCHCCCRCNVSDIVDVHDPFAEEVIAPVPAVIVGPVDKKTFRDTVCKETPQVSFPETVREVRRDTVLLSGRFTQAGLLFQHSTFSVQISRRTHCPNLAILVLST